MWCPAICKRINTLIIAFNKLYIMQRLVVSSGHKHYLCERHGFDIIVKKYCQFCHADAVFY